MRKYLFILCTILCIPAMANEGVTWFRSCAISPDGSTIVFTYKGDLFTVSSQGGQATRLTSNTAYDGYPHWSPDGKTIAFSSDRCGGFDVFTISKNGGTPKRLTTHSANETVEGFLDNQHVLYTSSYGPTATDIYFPGAFSQVYSVDTEGHRPQLFSVVAMEKISINKQGELLYQNVKGYEDEWRKHHRSPVTRDLYLTQANPKNRTFKQITTDNCEFRNPVWAPDGKAYYYLSEENGNMNIFKAAAPGEKGKQVTKFKDHPVRYLSVANNGTLCFSQDGVLYTMSEGGQPKKVNIDIVMDNDEYHHQPRTVSSGASFFDVSKDEKEIAFIVEGDLYTKTMDYATTKRLTTTPGAERHPSISPDGRTIVYASERDGSWNIYAMKLQNKQDKNFTYATDVKEEPLITGKEPYFLPKYSPDGKKIAFLANRTEIRVYDVKSKKIDVVLPAKYNFSYADGDMDFSWSPDSRWILTSYIGGGRWNNDDIAAVSIDGKQIINLTQSGYSDKQPQWALGGKAIIWASDRAGYRSHGSWGAEDDVYIMYLDKEAYELSKLNKEDRALYQERMKAAKDSTEQKDKKDKKDKKDGKDGKDNKDNKGKDEKAEKKDSTTAPLKLVFEGCDKRVRRLTINSSHLGGMYLTPDGKKLYYLASFEGGYDLWLHDLEENSTRIVSKGLGAGSFIPDKKGENIYLCNGSLRKLTLSNASIKNLPFSAEVVSQAEESRKSIYEHCVNQIRERFCDVNYHGIDFIALSDHYRRFLPEIDNNRDLGEMVSELLGELNCSHTGLRYRPSYGHPATAELGAIFDQNYEGDGLLISEVIKDGPMDLPEGNIKAGMIVKSIDHQPIAKGQDYFPLLAGKAGKWLLLTLTDENGKNQQEVFVKATSRGTLFDLLYERWVERNIQFTKEYSKGQIGYVHVKAMNSQSFRKVFSDVLGKNRECKALIVDERHNGGGWLHADLGILLSGKQFQNYNSRGQDLGPDPFNRWNRPSCVLICENCYSNAHGFPAMYKALNLGKLVGAPIAGTMTAVWWENVGGNLTIGLPQVNCLDMNGKPLENQQLDPDVEVYITPEQMMSGDDEQLKRAIDLMLETVK